MRLHLTRVLTAASSLVVLASWAGAARAQQNDLNPPKPNILLLIDNSGSMERMIDGSLPEDNAANACDVTNCAVNASGTTCTWAATPPAAPNRWNILLNTLVGSPTNGFHCVAMPRTTGTTGLFAQEYEIGGNAPYDTGYYLNYHRAIAKDTTTNLLPTPCTFAPGTLPGAAVGAGVGPNGYGTPGSADAFPAGAIINRPYGQVSINQTTGHTMSCQYALNSDGVLLSYQDLARFGLMTFDQDPSAATGVSPTTPYSVLPSPFAGMWSYYLNWGGGGASQPASGNPTGCVAAPFEVGARNPAAPPWEGRLVPFSASSDAALARETQNQQLRSVLSASRPYGATPIAGMLNDAMTYLWLDSNGPGDPVNGDPLIACGGRKQFIILLTDGAPNQDLRQSCGNADNPSAPCPYNLPSTTVSTLLQGSGSHQPVETFVIGFAVSSGTDQGGTLVNCSQLNPTGADCVNPTSTLAPCCQLQKIAVNGQPPAANPHAYFVDTPQDLSAALAAIFGSILPTTTRSTPALSPVAANASYSGSSASTASQSTYYGSFTPGSPVPSSSNLASSAVPWTGDITRSRFFCPSTTSALDATKGDDFAQDLAVASTRHFIAFEPATPIDSTATIRPFASATVGDGLGNYTAKQISDSATNVIALLTPPALNLTAGTKSCPYTSSLGTGTGFLTDTQCMTMLMDFAFGQGFSGGPSDFAFVSRAGTLPNGRALAFGGLYHAAPAVVGPPGSLLHDDSYDLYRTSSQALTPSFAASNAGARDTIVYAATTDGLLHAFWADENTQANNEEWALMPPAVMPQLQAGYPGSNQFLLDGSPIVKDAVWDRQQGSTLNASSNNPWRTTLVAGFGPTQIGYYAVDVSNPKFQSLATNPTETGASDPTGPTFLWQLTKMPPATDIQLFGHHGATPAITQVAINGTGGVHEVGVAILPGGWDTAAVAPAGTNVGCERDSHHRTTIGDWGPTGSTFKYRTDVRCWGTTGNYVDPVVGRSVSIVRLDTGEILATFMRKYDVTQYYPNDTLLSKGRVVDTPLDSPMVGTPVVFPSQTGSDATKFFLGDMDGTIWRFDISNADPTQWVGKLYFDMYNSTADTTTSGNDWANGQPIVLPMISSVDNQGRLVLNAATGTQDSFDTTGPNFLASILETVQVDGSGNSAFHAHANWFIGSALPSGPGVTGAIWDPGERVSGPMVVFNSTLYATTYSASASSTNACTLGDARLWAFNYVTAAGDTTFQIASTHATDGKAGVVPAVGFATTNTKSTIGYMDLANQFGNGVVVPGVALQQTTACVGVSSGTDQYVPGASHASVSTYSSTSFSLVAQAGASGAGGVPPSLNVALSAPNSPTLIDSWAAVTE